MALTPDQQADLDYQDVVAQREWARGTLRREYDAALETARLKNSMDIAVAQAAGQSELFTKQARLEAVRLAKETLIENARSKPVDARDVSAADIQAFAQTLVAYING